MINRCLDEDWHISKYQYSKLCNYSISDLCKDKGYQWSPLSFSPSFGNRWCQELLARAGQMQLHRHHLAPLQPRPERFAPPVHMELFDHLEAWNNPMGFSFLSEFYLSIKGGAIPNFETAPLSPRCWRGSPLNLQTNGALLELNAPLRRTFALFSSQDGRVSDGFWKQSRVWIWKLWSCIFLTSLSKDFLQAVTNRPADAHILANIHPGDP